jgi:hypothetical protein
MKTYGGMEVKLHIFLVAALDGEIHALANLPLGKKPPVTH